METNMLYKQVNTAVIDGEILPWVPLVPCADNTLTEVLQACPLSDWIVMMRTPLR